MVSPVVQLRVPAETLGLIDEARGAVSRSNWILSVINAELTRPAVQDGTRSSRKAAAPQGRRERAAGVTAEPRVQATTGPPARFRRDSDCPHPPGRVHKGLCGQCGQGGL